MKDFNFSWETMTVGKYCRLINHVETMTNGDWNDLDCQLEVLAILTGKTFDEIESMEWQVVKSLLAKMADFLFIQPKYKPKMWTNGLKLTINDKVYNILPNLNLATVKQKLQFDHAFTSQPHNFALLLSKLIIPKGRKWDDGYNMDEVVDDVNSMLFSDAADLAFFFVNINEQLQQCSRDYSRKKILKETKKIKKNLKKSTLTEAQRSEVEKHLEIIYRGLSES